MNSFTRRDLLTGAAGIRIQGANERIVLGIIGCGGMGMGHIRMLAARTDAQIEIVCDPDRNRADEAANAADSGGKPRPKPVQDLRRVLDNPKVDAVLIATPDHWHAPAAILACQAGKHVYVEKPCSHNVWEGRQLAEAARRHKRVVQTGTQSRSAKHVQEAMQALKEGIIGEVLVAKAWNSQLRANIGRASPSKPPDSLDYDMWVGPAPFVPHQSNRLHYTWHWWYDFGTGDIGNDGVHDLDIARWGLGVETHPSQVTAAGGKLFFDDDQQFPDTQTVVFDYPLPNGRKKQLIYEQRIWSPYHQEGHENGNAFYGTKGVMILGKKSGWQVTGSGNKPIKSGTGGLVHPDHHTDFFQSIKSRRIPTADAVTGHLSAALCHLGNIATRTGRALKFDPARERIVGDDHAEKLVKRAYRAGHWAIPRSV